MPTGYTEFLNTNPDTTFEQFALRCARNMGALIMMRDEPLDAPLPKKIEPYSYYAEKLEAAKAALADALTWTDERWAQEAEATYKAEFTRIDKANNEQKSENARYIAMLEQVQEWNPPTVEHHNLKSFMAEQLATSILDYTYTLPVQLTGEAYKAEHLFRLEEDVESRQKYYDEEVRRAEKRDNWLQSLRGSLKPQVSA